MRRRFDGCQWAERLTTPAQKIHNVSVSEKSVKKRKRKAKAPAAKKEQVNVSKQAFLGIVWSIA